MDSSLLQYDSVSALIINQVDNTSQIGFVGQGFQQTTGREDELNQKQKPFVFTTQQVGSPQHMSDSIITQHITR